MWALDILPAFLLRAVHRHRLKCDRATSRDFSVKALRASRFGRRSSAAPSDKGEATFQFPTPGRVHE